MLSLLLLLVRVEGHTSPLRSIAATPLVSSCHALVIANHPDTQARCPRPMLLQAGEGGGGGGGGAAGVGAHLLGPGGEPPSPPQGAGEIFLSLTSGRACALVAAAGDGPMLQVLIEQVWAMEKCGNSIKYVFLAEDR